MTSDDDRPKIARDRIIGGRVDEETFEAAQARAEREGLSLGELVRRFLFGWAQGEYPTPPPPPGEGRRAKKRVRREE